MTIVYSLNLKVISIFQIFTLCTILESEASLKKMIIEKEKQPLVPFS